MTASPIARRRAAGVAAAAGGLLGIVLAPIMVLVKYETGWAIVPEPSWIALVKPAFAGLLATFTPVQLWIIFGSLYTVALVLMTIGLVALAMHLRTQTGRTAPKGLWILLVGLCLVTVGDAVHTATWHQNGLTVPTPGTNPVANTAYATHMMGMNIVLIGCLMTGISALRRRLLAPPVAWLFLLVPPSAVALSLTLLPTTPSGGLWMFSVAMMAVGRAFPYR